MPPSDPDPHPRRLFRNRRAAFAERTRQTRARVEIRTIDSLIGQIAAAYHVGLGLPPDIAAWVRGRKNGHARLASTVAALLKRHPMIAAAVARRHSVVICDEHQDSSGDQHSVVMAIHHQGSALRVFSDPMQRIFDETTTGGTFAPCDWDSLKDQADALAQLDTPHRWSDGCQDLGRWTLAARRTLRAGGAVDLRSGLRPESVEVLFAENRAQNNLAYQLSPDDRRPVDEFERQHDSLLILTRHNPTAMSLRSLFNRRILLWEGYTRYALDGLVDAIRNANGDCGALAAAVVRFMGDVGKGFSPSVFGKIFEREVREGCSRTRRGRPEKVQAGISVLPAPDGPLYTRRAAERTKLLSSHIRPAPEAVTSARADVRPTGAPAFRAFLRHRSTRVPFLRQAGFVALSPRVSLPAPVAPRSSAASRRKAAGSDALPPAGASSTAHASPAAPRSSPAAAGDS